MKSTLHEMFKLVHLHRENIYLVLFVQQHFSFCAKSVNSGCVCWALAAFCPFSVYSPCHHKRQNRKLFFELHIFSENPFSCLSVSRLIGWCVNSILVCVCVPMVQLNAEYAESSLTQQFLLYTGGCHDRLHFKLCFVLCLNYFVYVCSVIDHLHLFTNIFCEKNDCSVWKHVCHLQVFTFFFFCWSDLITLISSYCCIHIFQILSYN